MDGSLERTGIRQRLAGKWQVPVFLMSAALLGGGLYRLTPEPPHVDLDARIRKMDLYIDGGLYGPALGMGRTLLSALGAEEYGQRARQVIEAPIHHRMARARILQAKVDQRRDGRTAKLALEEMKLARDGGVQLTAADHVLQAEGAEWLGQYRRALSYYEIADQLDETTDLALRQRVLEIMQGPLSMSPAEIEPRLDQFLVDASERLDLLEWALARKVDLLVDQGRTESLESLLDSYRSRFDSSEFADGYSYLEARVRVHQRRFDEAESMLRNLRNRLVERDELYAKSGWLLGRVVLSDGGPQRPQEAISFFRNVVSTHVRGQYGAASQLGIAEALVQLRRFDDALTHYDQAIEALPFLPPVSVIDGTLVRTSLEAAIELLRRSGEVSLALSFAERVPQLLATSDLESQSAALWRIGGLQAAVAAEWAEKTRQAKLAGEDPERIRDLMAETARRFSMGGLTFTTVAKLSVLDAKRSAAATWRAAEMYDRSGNRELVAVLLRTFLREHPNAPLVSRALLRLGQALQSIGRYSEAIEAYQEAQLRFPRTPSSAAALVPLSRCYVALGPDEYEMAERTLRLILDDSELFTPQAPEFGDAMFLLGNLLARRGEFERAISVLDEVLQRYPDDVRAPRARFLLADAFRRSGLALRAEQAEARLVGERKHLRAEQVKRLDRAEELFAELVSDYEQRGEHSLNELDAMYLRHARLFQGDCLYYTQRYSDALELYERSAWIYKESTASLGAYVQVINCHLFLGRQSEARAALMRALYLVDQIRDDQFAVAPAVFNTRADWRGYFQWLGRTDLL